jgi:hypothetical protein
MAKRSTKMKKPSDEQPALHMVIEKGHLVPASPFDFERLDSYRNGAKMLVWMSTDGDRPLVRRWWATIGNYIKHTNLPWSDRETASAAIKLALAMVVPFKMPSGQWSQYPRSLNDLDDTELDGAIRQMEQLLFDLTGTDVETLRREAGSLGDEPFETNPPANDAGEETLAGDAVPPIASEESTSAGPDTPPAAGTGATDTPETATGRLDDLGSVQDGLKMSTDGQLSPGDESGPAPDDGGGADTPAAPPPTELSAEERLWLKQGAKMMLACLPSTDPESMRVLVGQLRLIRDLAPKDVGNACLSRMEVIRLHTTGVCKGQHDLDVSLVAKTALCSVEDVTPDPVKVRDGK